MNRTPQIVAPNKTARWIAKHHRGLTIAATVVIAIDTAALVIRIITGGGIFLPIVVLIPAVMLPFTIRNTRRDVERWDAASRPAA